MAPPADRVYLAAREVLDTVVAGYVAAQAGTDWLADSVLPDRQLVSVGPPAWDVTDEGCAGGVVAVWVERVYPHAGNVVAEPADAQAGSAGHVLRGWFVRIQIARCVPTLDDQGNPPDAGDEEAAAEVLLRDCQLVQNVLRAAEKDGTLTRCNDLAFVEWVSVGPDGAMAGGTHGYRMNLAR